MAKVIAFQPKNRVVVSMSVTELLNFSGVEYGPDFLHKDVINSGSVVAYETGLMEHEVPIGAVFKDARETLATYSDLKTKLESVRNQITTLTGKMKPEEDEK